MMVIVFFYGRSSGDNLQYTNRNNNVKSNAISIEGWRDIVVFVDNENNSVCYLTVNSISCVPKQKECEKKQ